jgi:hypothetical protein
MKKIPVAFCLLLVFFMGTFVFAQYAAAADRFVDNKNGPVTDTQTGLMWAAQDNGSDINWYNAKSYCEGFSKGGGSWRLPTQSELSGLYSSGLRSWGSHAIKLSGYEVWASEERTSIYGSQDGGDVYFVTGSKGWFPKDKAAYHDNAINSQYTTHRALPVRKAQ